MKRLILLLALLIALPVSAQEKKFFVQSYDLASTSLIYCRTSETELPGGGRIKTSGSSTTVTAYTVGETPFDPVAVGDLLIIQYGGTVHTRTVATKASGASITVDSAITLTNGAMYRYRDVACGTAAADGWVGIGNSDGCTVQITITSLNAASLQFQVEGIISGTGAAAVPVSTLLTYTAAGGDFFDITESLDSVRVGMKVNTDAGANVVTVNMSCRTRG
jgi:hypothetical protein